MTVTRIGWGITLLAAMASIALTGDLGAVLYACCAAFAAFELGRSREPLTPQNRATPSQRQE